MRKLILLLTLSLSLGFYAFASDEIVVSQTTGNTTYSIAKVKEFTFDGKGVKITFSDNTSAYFDAGALSMISFNATASNVNLIEATQAIVMESNFIIVNGNKGDIKVYSLAGTIVAQGKGEKLDISHLNDGSYIVQARSLISKIIKR